MLPSRPFTHSLNNPAGLNLVFCMREDVKVPFEALVSILVLGTSCSNKSKELVRLSSVSDPALSCLCSYPLPHSQR